MCNQFEGYLVSCMARIAELDVLVKKGSTENNQVQNIHFPIDQVQCQYSFYQERRLPE